MNMLRTTAGAALLAGVGLLAAPASADAGGISLRIGSPYGGFGSHHGGFGSSRFGGYDRFSRYGGGLYGSRFGGFSSRYGGYGSRFGGYGYARPYHGGGYGGYHGGHHGGGHVGVPVPGHLVPHGDHFDLVPGHPPGCSCSRCRH